MSEATGGKPGPTPGNRNARGGSSSRSGRASIRRISFESLARQLLRRTRICSDAGEKLAVSENSSGSWSERPPAYEVFSLNGTTYAEYDSDINMLFANSWSMLERRSQTTYAWREHENLIENYLVERLEVTARIAITKHPHQCKYGEIAQSLADEIRSMMPVVNIIREFDPLPDACPECREVRPAHRVNCMAAICWRCKYPTPPSEGWRR